MRKTFQTILCSTGCGGSWQASDVTKTVVIPGHLSFLLVNMVSGTEMSGVSVGRGSVTAAIPAGRWALLGLGVDSGQVSGQQAGETYSIRLKLYLLLGVLTLLITKLSEWNKNIFASSIIFQHEDDPSCSSDPNSWKTKNHLYHKIDMLASDDLVTLEASVSTAMVLA